MSENIHSIKDVDDYEGSSEVRGLYRAAFEQAARLDLKSHILENVIKIEESKSLKSTASTEHDTGMRAFRDHAYMQMWYRDYSYEGMLEGRVSKSSPENNYLLWLVKDGELYLKWVQGRYEDMIEQIRAERNELRNRMYSAKLKRKFQLLLEKIQNEITPYDEGLNRRTPSI